MMSRRRLLAWIAVFVFVGLAFFGFLIFAIAVVIELMGGEVSLNQDLSPTIQLGLAGLGLAALMITLGFVLVGLLLARQTRRLAPGYGDAYRFMQTMQFAQAVPVLERAVESGRVTPDLLMLLTSAYAYTGQIAKAQATADRAVQMFPQDASAYVSLANGYRVQASYDEAARALQTAAKLSPEQAIVWAELGFVYLMASEDTAAFEAFQTAAQFPMPAMYRVRVAYHLARFYRQKGDDENAKTYDVQMLASQEGLAVWQSMQQSLEGTLYGTSLRYEIESIQKCTATGAINHAIRCNAQKYQQCVS
jgi:tetratricopeptide (TPR) repeat protein